MILGIVGSRSYTDYNAFRATVDGILQNCEKPSMIVSGGASGVDKLAEIYAREKQIHTTIFPAEWTLYGK
jgi:predicted Rossmann fold nucleotide-binding protein DprA/Smf involved in DNA uptake